MINGNTQGVRKSLLDEMERMYQADMETLRHEFISRELMEDLAQFTSRINREISIYIARDGMVMDVTIGQNDRVGLPDLRVRRGARRLTGIRCIHTHPEGSVQLSAVDEKTLERMHFDAMAALGVLEGRPAGLGVAILTDLLENGEYRKVFYGPFAPGDVPHNLLMDEIRDSAERIGKAAHILASLAEQEERAILVGLDADGTGQDSLDELERLADTAGARVLRKELQRKGSADPATYLGKGKVAELALIRQGSEANLIIVDDELTGVQIRNLEQALGCKVIDRTSLILDIFAGRATTHEGKLQVELAQYKYKLPRLTGMGGALSRLGGGIGTRGPGESKLETDRRAIHRRIHELEMEKERLDMHRKTQRRQRERSGVPVVALVGYTNAGKSTLLNALSGSSVFAEDKLFATLDPVTRRVVLPGGTEVLLTDTVGFIRKLPHDLVDAFRSTLEEAVHADLLLHVVDASSPDRETQYRVAEDVLVSLGVGDSGKIVVFNKCDRGHEDVLPDTEGFPRVEISALLGTGLDELKESIERMLTEAAHTRTLLIPFDRGSVLSQLHDQCKVLSQEYQENGVLVEVAGPADVLERIEKLLS